MGYTTDFEGRFTLNKKLTKKDQEFLTKFASTRRMKRDAAKLKKQYGKDFGIEGEFFVDGDGFHGQGDGGFVLEHNDPPSTQPGLWCQWIPTPDGKGIEWDGGEKFYNYVEWLQYIVDNFLEPKGYKLNGTVEWQGEDGSDRGQIVVKNNKIKTLVGKIVYVEESEA